MTLSEEQKREKINAINKKWYVSSAKEHDEESIIQNFIYPLLEVLGWNLAIDLKREVNRIDCVLYLNKKPYIGIEAKSFSYGPLEDTKSGVAFNKDRLLRKCREICADYAAISRYIETIIYRVEDGKIVAFFNHPKEYIDNLKALEVLEKPSK